MNKDEIVHILNFYFRDFRKLFDKLIDEPESENVYSLWKEFKQLRAFLRIVNIESANDSTLKLPNEMKTVYGYLGIVRDLQWLEHKIKNINLSANEIKNYPNQLTEELNNWKLKLHQAIHKNPLPDAKEELHEHLPKSIHQTTIENFIQDKVAKIKLLLENKEQEDNLILLRKNLRDILYNIFIFNQKLGNGFPVKICSQAKLKEIEKAALDLEYYDDLTTAIDLLQPRHYEKLSDTEADFLKSVSKKIRKEKKQFKPLLMHDLNSLNNLYLPSHAYSAK
ncbi:CHAD domain-containing protein [Solitalea canadensis]|uniref:CHAD domain-containing protein n=1 Tax=Solitalea canadensis (strain ATCC 29591 / DSM 3403 / JCM 21819 / LMG 8368 / NBRC 15130 / NCIMB 12057 / USAM 9D) TaxID=929556 RepID=H8KQC8_SOLCM|nr:CHAD domain-containing protein [Solitalea canadensis]AFD06544.1 CHAD domain-containing protein [Solitalea canadensis DSM 3403]